MLVWLVPAMLLAFSGLMLVALEFGWRWAQRRHATGQDSNDNAIAAVQAALFGLTGLLMAFTYSGAAERYERRRQLAVEESNDIGTAYLRIDLLPAAAQPAMRDLFRRYTDSRIAAYHALPDLDAAREALTRSAELQQEIWRQAVAVAHGDASEAATRLVIPALNDMFDITTTRTVAAYTHLPYPIVALLGVLALVSAVVTGYGIGGRPAHNWLHMLGFALVVSATIWIIVDFEFPRMGLIRLDMFDQLLVDVRAVMQ